jgi:hypothetical protein
MNQEKAIIALYKMYKFRPKSMNLPFRHSIADGALSGIPSPGLKPGSKISVAATRLE